MVMGGMWFVPKFLFACILIFILLGNGHAEDCGANGPNARKLEYTITVKGTNQRNFNTIQAAINSIPSRNDRWIRILVAPGTYREKVTIPVDKPCIILEGNSSENTIISWNDHQATDQSATFTSLANNFVAKNIGFKNSYPGGGTGRRENDQQSVAVEVHGDKTAFHECSFCGIQDTLWDAKGRHYFQNCYIEGAVDFIWGSGRSIYEGCEIAVLPTSGNNKTGYITAQGRNSSTDNGGFVFKSGKVFGIDYAHAYLGRGYGAYSTVIWSGTHFSQVIVPQGWDAWRYVNHVENLEYVEANCHGEGADLSKRVTWINRLPESEVKKFTNISYIDQGGWLANQP